MQVNSGTPVLHVVSSMLNYFKIYVAEVLQVDYNKCGSQIYIQKIRYNNNNNTYTYDVIGLAYAITQGKLIYV